MSRVVRLNLNDLSQIKANIESLGHSVEVRQMCGISWTDEENPDIVFTDGNEAVGEIVADTPFGPVPIPVCERCLELVSVEFKGSFAKDLRE